MREGVGSQMRVRACWMIVLAFASGCTPTTPSTWTLNWMRDGDDEAFSPFDTVDGDVLTTMTTRIRTDSLSPSGWVLSERRRVIDVDRQEVLSNRFTDWPAYLRGSAERPTVRVDVSVDQPLVHADGTCQRVEWPEYESDPDVWAIFWCRGIYAEETIWLGM